MTTQQINSSTASTFSLSEIYTEHNYIDAGKRLAKAGYFLNWQIGRWYNALRWGDKREICEKVGVNYASAKDCGSIEKKIKMSMRNDNLTFQHHKVIAIDALNDSQRNELLQKAEDSKMSSKQLTTARDLLLDRDTKPGIYLPDTAETNIPTEQTSDSPAPINEDDIPAIDNAIPTQSNNNTANEEVDTSKVDNPEDKNTNEAPVVNTTKADKELTNLKQVNIDLVVKYNTEHQRTVTLEGDIRDLKSKIEKLEETISDDENIITKLNDRIAKLQGKKTVNKKAAKNHKVGSTAELLARSLPDEVGDTTDMRNALAEGYRKANGINNLKANDIKPLTEYLESLSADEINQLIQIKKEALRAKARAKKLGRSELKG